MLKIHFKIAWAEKCLRIVRYKTAKREGLTIFLPLVCVCVCVRTIQYCFLASEAIPIQPREVVNVSGRWVDKTHLVFYHIVTFCVHSFHQKGIYLGNLLHLTASYILPEEENTGRSFQRKVPFLFFRLVIFCIVRTYNKFSVRCAHILFWFSSRLNRWI